MAVAVVTVAFAPWQQRVYDLVADSAVSGRLPHALLLCGPARLGKQAVAIGLAQWLLCERRGDSKIACGDCRSCVLFAAGTHPDLKPINREENEKTGKLRTDIIVDQVRGLGEWFTLTPSRFGMQVAIIDPADAFNLSASNALLKTLEEPLPGRLLMLVSADPARLPATIRSRCQRLEFRLPPRDEAVAWLRAQGHADKAAAEALEAARGHPGLADAWLRDGGIELRREVSADLAKLARGDAAAIETAQRWAGDEDAPLRLRHAADLALAEAAGLTDPARMRKLAQWFDAANRTRDLLRTTVRADLAIAELLLDWRGNAPPAAEQRGRR